MRGGGWRRGSAAGGGRGGGGQLSGLFKFGVGWDRPAGRRRGVKKSGKLVSNTLNEERLKAELETG